MALRSRRVVVVAMLVGALLVAATTWAMVPRLRVARRRVERRAELKSLLASPPDVSIRSQDRFAESLLSHSDDPDALDALLDQTERAESNHSFWREPVLHAFELWAIEPDPRDARPVDHLAAIAHDSRRSEDSRLWALYLLEELRSPRYPPEPESFPKEPWFHAEMRDALPFVLGLGVSVDPPTVNVGGTFWGSPYSALVRVAQKERCVLEHEGDRWRLTHLPGLEWYLDDDRLELVDVRGSTRKWLLLGRDGARFDGVRLRGIGHALMAPEKYFRAVAALRGCTPPRQIAPDTWETAPVSSTR
jgi:hypothetical protein